MHCSWQNIQNIILHGKMQWKSPAVKYLNLLSPKKVLPQRKVTSVQPTYVSYKINKPDVFTQELDFPLLIPTLRQGL